MDIIGVKSEKGYYLKGLGSNRYNSALEKLIINGKNPESTFHPHWFLTDSEPQKIERIVKRPRINHRFELKSDVDAPWIDRGALPQSMPKDEVIDKNKDGYCDWKDEFKHLQSLYVEVSDEQQDVLEPVEFSYQTILEIKDIKTAENFSYAVKRIHYQGNSEIDSKGIIHQEVDRIIFPEIVLPNLPCKLSSKDSYDIIREHVKRNIDTRYAEITIDYDYYFAVKKIVPLYNPIEKDIEIKNARGRSYKKPKYRKLLVKNRYVDMVFSMANGYDKYKNYPVISEFTGKDQQDLKKNIDEFLDNLMARINEPLVDCPHCNGFGVITKNNG